VLPLLVIFTCSLAAAQSLYERPVLVVDPGMHTAPIRSLAGDATGRLVATGSYDKTVRVWSVTHGKLLQTIRVPAGPGNVGKIFAVAMSPNGNVVAAGGWTEGPPQRPIYLFDASTGKMTGRISDDLPNLVERLVFSGNGRYLAATLSGDGGLRVFDGEKNWSEVLRDTDYRSTTYGAAFADDGRLATASSDGKIRLYDRSFGLVSLARDAPRGRFPWGLAFSPDGKLLALGYYDKPVIDVLNVNTLVRLPGPNTDGLRNGNLAEVAWSMDGQTDYAAGQFNDDTGNAPVLAWDRAVGEPRVLSTCGSNSDTITGLLPLSAGQLLVATIDPCLTLLDTNGKVHWLHRSPGADFRGQRRSFAASADGTIIAFGFRLNDKAPRRFDLRALTLSDNRPTRRCDSPTEARRPFD
jgi:WD40 repeat protein